MRQERRKRATCFFLARPAGDAFARATGARHCTAIVQNRLVVDTVALRIAEDLRKARDPVGYEIRTFTGSVPEPYVDGVAHLHGRMSTDAPQDDLVLEPAPFDAARFRARETAMPAWGRRPHVAVALREAAVNAAPGYEGSDRHGGRQFEL